VFVEPIGGVGWAVPFSVVTAAGITLGFNVTNPAILYRDLAASPVKEIAAPVRRILLATRIEAPPGMEAPKVTLSPLSKESLAPGETIPGGIVVAGTGGTGGGFADCLRAGNLWCWLILLLVLLLLFIIVAVSRRRKATP